MTTPDIALLTIVPKLAEDLADPSRFERTYQASPGGELPRIRELVGQQEAYRTRLGTPPEWAGFLAVDESTRRIVGTCAYKGVPDAKRSVEIAYGTLASFEGRGYGTAMAAALFLRAVRSGQVALVYAHTLPQENASTTILARNGFVRNGLGEDDEVGTVWRWERAIEMK